VAFANFSVNSSNLKSNKYKMKKPKNSLVSQLMASLNIELKKESIISKEKNGLNFINRRNFISDTTKAAIGAAVVFNLPTTLSSCRTVRKETPDNILDVAILGGGIAGLNCANHLIPSNLNFKIFEAHSRLGGRILTHYNDSLGLGIFPEFGGDFIDSSHEDMLSLAKEFNLELLDLEAEQKSKNLIKDIYFFDNRKISEREIITEFKKITGKIAKDRISLGENYDTPDAQRLDNTPLSDYFNSLKCAGWLKELFTAAFIAEYGLDCEEQSTINFLDMIDTDTGEGFKVFGDSDERFRVKGGNSKIIEGLIKNR
jgi:monoamine oxidase